MLRDLDVCLMWVSTENPLPYQQFTEVIRSELLYKQWNSSSHNDNSVMLVKVASFRRKSAPPPERLVVLEPSWQQQKHKRLLLRSQPKHENQ